MYICQFKKNNKFIFLLLIFILGACATKKIVLPTKEVNPTWFDGGKDFSYKNYEGRTIGHLFFDFAPRIDMRRRVVDVFITTPRDSAYQFNIDLVSGRLFKERNYCKTEDIWKNYTSTINRPNFSWAYIPRLLGTNGRPQRVAVFGKNKYLVDGKFPKEETIQVQVIGGVILKSCLSGLCDLKAHWDSEVILIAKSMLDEDLTDAQGPNSIKKFVDWGYFKAFLENSMGHNEIGRLSKGAYRVESQILPTRALKHVINSGHLFTSKELGTLRRSCQKVYSDALNIFKTKDGISKRFSDYYEKDWNKFLICRKYVRHFNIQDQKDNHWLIEYLSAFEYASESSYYYNCRSRTWVRNVKNSKGKFAVDAAKVIKDCSDQEVTDLFPSAISLLTSLASANIPHYRYIEYDSGADTFNQKIYNWVWFSGKKLSCDNSKVNQIFPEDVNFNLK